MDPEGLLLHSQEPATSFYRRPDKSSLSLPIPLPFEYHLTIPHSLAMVLDGGEWLMPHTSLFTHRKETPCHLYRNLGKHQDQSGHHIKFLPH